jgi:hypothetical protein
MSKRSIQLINKLEAEDAPIGPESVLASTLCSWVSRQGGETKDSVRPYVDT